MKSDAATIVASATTMKSTDSQLIDQSNTVWTSPKPPTPVKESAMENEPVSAEDRTRLLCAFCMTERQVDRCENCPVYDQIIAAEYTARIKGRREGFEEARGKAAAVNCYGCQRGWSYEGGIHHEPPKPEGPPQWCTCAALDIRALTPDD